MFGKWHRYGKGGYIYSSMIFLMPTLIFHQNFKIYISLQKTGNFCRKLIKSRFIFLGCVCVCVLFLFFIFLVGGGGGGGRGMEIECFWEYVALNASNASLKIDFQDENSYNWSDLQYLNCSEAKYHMFWNSTICNNGAQLEGTNIRWWAKLFYRPNYLRIQKIDLDFDIL